MFAAFVTAPCFSLQIPCSRHTSRGQKALLRHL